MKANWARTQKQAHKVLQAMGMPVTLLQSTHGTLDVHTGTVSGASVLEFHTFAAEVPITEEYADGKKREFVDEYDSGTSTVIITARLFLSPLHMVGNKAVPGEMDPKLDDVIVIPTGRLVIVTAKPLMPSGTPLGFDLTLRG